MGVRDNTVLGGLISAATLIALHYVVACATFKSERLEGNDSPKVPAGPPQGRGSSKTAAPPPYDGTDDGPGRAFSGHAAPGRVDDQGHKRFCRSLSIGCGLVRRHCRAGADNRPRPPG